MADKTGIPYKNNSRNDSYATYAWQQMQDDLDYKLDQMNRNVEEGRKAIQKSTKSMPDVQKRTSRKSGQVKSPMHRQLTDTELRQQQLKNLGFYKGKVDNIFGAQSRAAHQAAIDAGYEYKNGQYVKANQDVPNMPNLQSSAGLSLIGIPERESELGNITTENATSRQKQLKDFGFYEGEVDGRFGEKSREAHMKALNSGYVYENGEYKRSLGKTLSEYGNKIKNAFRNSADVNVALARNFNPVLDLGLKLIGVQPQTPAGMAASDIMATTKNEIARAITGNKDLTVVSQGTVTSLPEDQMSVLRKHYESLPEQRKTNGTWYAGDYRRTQGNYARGDRLLERITTPEHMVANTLGQYSYYRDKNGNVIVQDVYDFGERASKEVRKTEGVYDWVREQLGKLGSTDESADAQKRHFRINLGNPDNGWEITK